MLFNSLAFAVFLPLALLVYWPLRHRVRLQNLVIVALSYVFYGWWDWRFLSLLVASTVLDYCVGRGLEFREDPRTRKLLLTLSVIGNLGILGFFKYYGFFVNSLVKALDQAGVQLNLDTLHIILPVGISFYTFQTMSYTIDVYRREIKPTHDIVALAAYVAFFPQLVAGPIERGARLLPQILRRRDPRAEDFEEGLWLLVLGFFRKSVLADNVAFVVDRVYNHPEAIGAPTLIVATLAFAVQIYCDFSGYSNMARGTAKLFGFDLMVNFRVPYASTSIQEFWRRWHISLSSWLRDYLYISLGGNQRGRIRTYVNLMTTMLLGGLWHGAAWNFVIWGFWQGLGLVFHRLVFRKNPLQATRGALAQSAITAISWTLTFLFVLQGWVLFRVYGLKSVVVMSKQWFNWSVPLSLTTPQTVFVVGCFAISCAIDYMESRNYENLVLARMPLLGRVALGGLVIAIVVALGSFRQQPFLYFQF